MDEKKFREAIEFKQLNKAAIAKAMYPSNEYGNTRLANKLKGTANQRLTEEDLKKGEEVLRNLADAIYAKLPPLQNGQDPQS